MSIPKRPLRDLRKPKPLGTFERSVLKKRASKIVLPKRKIPKLADPTRGRKY